MKTTRREMLCAGLATAAIAAAGRSEAAVAPKTAAVTSGDIAPFLKLSCCAYSLRDYLPNKGKPGKFTLLDWLEMAADWELDGVEVTSYYFTSETPADMYAIKAKAFKLGLDISGTSVGNSFCGPAGEGRDKQIDLVKRWVDHSVEMGAPCMRVFAGGKPKEGERKTHFDAVVECLKPCADYAGSKGVFLALENHGYLTETAADVLAILDAVSNEWLGVNLDTGNFVSDPYKNIETIVPKAITAHAKTEVCTTDGSSREPADYLRIMKILRAANYRGYVSLEYEADEDAMTGVPKQLAALRAAMEAAASGS